MKQVLGYTSLWSQIAQLVLSHQARASSKPQHLPDEKPGQLEGLVIQRFYDCQKQCLPVMLLSFIHMSCICRRTGDVG